jgi:GNAT superfamily N-acetyltransferase
MSISVRRFSGIDAHPYLQDLARLRIEVFREFPYLYDGNLEYERNYLNTYTGVANAVVVVAFDSERVIGASTALPLASETDEISKPFIENGYDVDQVFYFGESVLEKRYRGRGIGVRFFEEREAHARSLAGYRWTAFCAVQRPFDHPRRPAGYVPLDEFWEKRGYRKHPELNTTLSWQDLDERAASPKPMVFWIKRID